MRIANCSGFYGDRASAAHEQVHGGPIDVLTGDWLAELTMALLVRDRMKDPNGGYAKSFVPQMRGVLAACLEKNIRIVSNAGGLNPKGLADALAALAKELGLSPRIAWVQGDAVHDRLQDWQDAGHPMRHLHTGQALNDVDGVVLSANAYLGCWPIARALDAGADIVITGRCTDAAVVMGAAAHGHGWTPNDADALAGALVAGHIIECGAQATGGNLSFYEEVPELGRVGFPIADIAADGTSVITKHPGTGGVVTVDSVKAQLLYEVAAPAYLSPDVTADFRTVNVQAIGADQVRISGTRALPAPTTLKVGLNLTAGFRNQVKVLLGGPHVRDKARRVQQAFWSALGGEEAFLQTRSELIGGHTQPTSPSDALAVLLLTARSMDRRAVGRSFTGAAVEMALASVPGLTLLDPPGPPRPCIQFWPAAVERSEIPVHVHLDDAVIAVDQPVPKTSHVAIMEPAKSDIALASQTGSLGEWVGTRSGDKAGSVNIGFWVRDPEHTDWLRAVVTAGWVADVLEVDEARISVYGLPNLAAVNVVIEDWLGLGVGASLAADGQGKCLAEFFRTVRVACPEP